MQATIYRRYSSREQARGSSLARQSALCEEYCERKGWNIEEVVSDEGTSAWTGANIIDGNLAQLTERLVRDGRNRVIVVEQLDRITRQPPNIVINWLTRITDAGAALATINDDVLITARSFSENPMNTMGLVFNAYRAFAESQHKSDRLAAAWESKRASGKPLTKQAVAWVRLVDGKFEIVQERAAVVRRIFELAISGMGAIRIARTLNEEGVEPFGRSSGWHVSYVRKILHNRAVVGEFQPHVKPKAAKQRTPIGDPIINYYPAVVSERDFALVHSQRPTIRQASARKFANLLSGLTRCGVCGGKLTFINSGIETLANGSKVRREYLQCEQSRRARCQAKRRYPYRETLDWLLDAALAGALRGTAEPNTQARELEEEVAGLERQARDADIRARRLLTLVEDGDDDAVKRYRALRDERKSVRNAARSARSKLEAEKAMPRISDMAQRARELIGRIDDDEDARREVKFALDRFLQVVTFHPSTGEIDPEFSPEIMLYLGMELSPQLRAAADAAKGISL